MWVAYENCIYIFDGEQRRDRGFQNDFAVIFLVDFEKAHRHCPMHYGLEGCHKSNWVSICIVQIGHHHEQFEITSLFQYASILWSKIANFQGLKSQWSPHVSSRFPARIKLNRQRPTSKKEIKMSSVLQAKLLPGFDCTSSKRWSQFKCPLVFEP